MKIQLKHSNVLNSSSAQEPTAPNMLDGELAVNFNANDPAIFLKDSTGNIVRIAGKDNLAFTGYEATIQAAPTPPSGLEAGNLYFDTDDNRLYYYYFNGTTTEWVDASTEKFDVSIIPDPADPAHQSGTLDDRYVNSSGDTMTGNLVLNAGVNLNSSDVYLNNGKIVFEGASANSNEIRLTVIEPTGDRTLYLPDNSGTLVSSGDISTITSAMIANGTIVNSDISNSAAIQLSKLGTGQLPSGITITNNNIIDGSISNADINNAAGIALTKLATGALPSGITITSSAIVGGVAPSDIAAGTLPTNVIVPSAATNLGYTASTSTITSSSGTGVALPLFASNNAGLVQGSGGGTTKFLRADGTWKTIARSVTSIGTSAPSGPNVGDSWYDTDEGRTYIYYEDTDSSQWVEANPSWNGSIPIGSVIPDYLSTGGPNWDASGNLGIGTTTPGDKLEINGDGAGIIIRSPDSTRYRITVSNGGSISVTAV